MKLLRKKGPMVILTFNYWMKDEESTKKKGTSKR